MDQNPPGSIRFASWLFAVGVGLVIAILLVGALSYLYSAAIALFGSVSGAIDSLRQDPNIATISMASFMLIIGAGLFLFSIVIVLTIRIRGLGMRFLSWVLGNGRQKNQN